MRVLFFLLSALLIGAGLILTIVVFFHLLRYTFNPQDLDSLVTDWSALLANSTAQASGDIIDPKEGPARWFAIAVLLTLAFLFSRIPLILIRMGTILFEASQHSQRQTKAILREVLFELRYYQATDTADHLEHEADDLERESAISEAKPTSELAN